MGSATTGGCPGAVEAPEGALIQSWGLRKGFLDEVISKPRPLCVCGGGGGVKNESGKDGGVKVLGRKIKMPRPTVRDHMEHSSIKMSLLWLED